MLASKGYPESSSKGDVITGVDDAEPLDGRRTSSTPAPPLDADGDLVTAGGRVLA